MDSAIKHRTMSVKLWPPSQSTRLMLVERMTNNLITPSIISRKYGLLSKEEAEEDAKQIEEQAFARATIHHETEPDGDGSSAVQIYAKESSNLMIEVLKRGPKSIEQDSKKQPIITQSSTFDISGGRRAFIEAEEAEEIMKPLTDPDRHFTKICLSNRSFGLAAATVAQPILSSIKQQLSEVDLSDIVAGRPESEALEVMKMLSTSLEGCNLKTLNLSNNALGEKGVRAFESLLRSQKNLEELYLINDGISEEAARAVRELLPSTSSLKLLHFHNNMTGDEGAVSIAEIVQSSPLLQDFRCSSTRIASEGGAALSEALGACPNLQKLDIRDNMFGIPAALSLSNSIPSFTSLQCLYLSYLNLEDEGAEAISNALRASPCPLEVLEMAGNDITAKGAGFVAECVAGKASLVVVNLSENEMKDEGAVMIGKAIEMLEKVVELDMSNNGMRRAGARCLASAVVGKLGFKMLNINGNYISDEGVDEILHMFKDFKEVLGPLDENDPEGEGEGEDFEDENHDKDDQVAVSLQSLEINRD